MSGTVCIAVRAAATKAQHQQPEEQLEGKQATNSKQQEQEVYKDGRSALIDVATKGRKSSALPVKHPPWRSSYNDKA